MTLCRKSAFGNIAGSLGDLSMFLPLAFGLIAVNGMNPTAIFLSAGIMYIAAGGYFRLPIPVQPMKAMATIAIATCATPETISTAAFGLACILLLASLCPLDGWFRKVFSRPVVRGIQLGLGVLLVKRGVVTLAAQAPGALPIGTISPIHFGTAIWIAVAAIIYFSRDNRLYPSALAVVAFGLLLAGWSGSIPPLTAIRLGWIRPEWMSPESGGTYAAFFSLVLPQIPLTLANSVIATTDTARCFYGSKASRVTHRSLFLSMGFGNLVFSLFGGMPVCHGASGVTAHYLFGARTGRANYFIGGVFVLSALVLGHSIASLAGLFPLSVLGALLISIGVRHAMLIHDVLELPRELAIVVVIACLTLITGNLAIAFAVGTLANLVLNKVRGLRLPRYELNGDAPRVSKSR